MEILLIIPLLFLSAFYSGSETAIYSMSSVRLDYLSNQGLWRARLIKWLRSPMGPTIITILIANNVVAELLARITEQTFSPLGGYSVLLTTLVMTPLLIIFGEFLPKWLGRNHSDRLVYQISGVLFATRIVLCIPVWILKQFTSLLHYLIPGQRGTIWEPHTSRPNLRTFIRSPENSQIIAPVQQRLIDRILAIERLTLAYERIAKPLEVVQILDQNLTVSQVLPTLGPKFFQRYLIGNPTTRMAVGWISSQALVTGSGDIKLRDLMQDLPRLPSTTPLHNALQRMHADGAEMVLVTDRSGRPQRVAFRGDLLRTLLNLS